MRFFSTLLAAFVFLPLVSAQTAPNFFTPVKPEAIQLAADAARQFEPKAFHAFRLDYAGLVAWLANAPMENTPEADQRAFQVQLPTADGTLETFAIEESPIMESELQGRHPEIRTYRGVSMENPGKILRLAVTPGWGLNVMICRPDKEGERIQRLAQGQNEYYMVFDQRDYPWELTPPARSYSVSEPSGNDARFAPAAPGPADRSPLLTEEVILKSYRLAISTTGEFSQDNGGTKALVMQRIVEIVNNMNTFYERDLAVKMVLVNDQENCIWLDPATDPFGDDVFNMLSNNALALLQGLGDNDKYDIGHVFARYLGGPALGVGALGVVCTQTKAQGASAGWPPYSVDFETVVGQEIGHQWGAKHTWNHCGNSPADNSSATCEPGSGSTIMSYAGACGGDNVSNSAAPYYHACSIFEIRNFIENSIAGTCGTNTNTGNHTPETNILHPGNLFIPISTPFELFGEGTDPDGDPLTFSWDEIDLGPSVALGQSQGSSPLFRWFEPTGTPHRVFPRIQTVLANATSPSELLPTYSRDITFALVARDNRPGGGGIGFDTIELRSTALAGPFRVTYPNDPNLTWRPGEFQTITWDVANTDKAPVNCQTVDILLSTDGGFTYPVTLAAEVPNNGAYCVLVPDNVSNNARIKVKAHGNVFFDLSNANLKIQAPTQPGFGICSERLLEQQCLPNTYSTSISTSAWGGFSDGIELSVPDLPAGVTANFSSATVQPGQDATLDISFPAGFAEGVYTFTVTATSGANTATSSVQLTVVSNDFSAFALVAPTDGVTLGDYTPVVKWNAVPDANGYDVQVATSPSFGQSTLIATLSNTALDSFQIPVVLQAGQVYYWRVRPLNECGAAPWSEAKAFAVAAQNCQTYTATDVPLVLSSTGTPTKESKITVGANSVITDINVKRLAGAHQGFNQLKVSLIAPNNTEIVLFQNKCGPNYYAFDLGFDGDAVAPFSCPPNNVGAPVQPAGALNSLVGLTTNGTWTLRASDNAPGQQGSISAFELELCSASSANAPVLVTNNPLDLDAGTNGVIDNTLLKAEDADNTASQLTYTLLTLPTQGDLQRNWGGALKVGDQFTQADLDAGLVRYFHYYIDSNVGDNFRFALTDGAGGLLVEYFTINPLLVSTNQPQARLDFSLAPNPASGSALLSMPDGVSSETRVAILNAAGQRLREWIVPAGQRIRQLDLADLPSGIYAVTVRNEQGVGTKKLVVR